MFRVAIAALAVCTCLCAQEMKSGFWRGRPVVYQVINGVAVAEGDILLDNVTEAPSDGKDAGRDSIVVKQVNARWRNGVVPYVIDSGLPQQQRVHDAVKHWNENTPIQLVERTNETAYVRFVKADNVCNSFIGMIGREQVINLGDNCATGAVIHEIGHAVGLFHEQSRQDRNFYIALDLANADKRAVFNYDQALTDGLDTGGYDFSSIMHYEGLAASRNGLPVIKTVPLGMLLGQRSGLTAADIDGVKRLYGYPINEITVTTNPPGLEIEVDGERFRAPRTFQWPADSQHTLSVPDVVPGSNASSRYKFGRWSDDGERSHRIQANVENTSVYTANFISQYRFPMAASPANAGRVEANPPPDADGYYPEGAIVELAAVPNDGVAFSSWTGVVYSTMHGNGAARIRIPMLNEGSLGLRYTANFTTAPLTTITSDPPGLSVRVDNVTVTTPRNFTWAAGTTHTIAVDTSTQFTGARTARHLFQAWSDGGDPSHTVTAGEARTITAQFQTQYAVTTSASPSRGGRVDISPGSSDGFYEAGSTVRLSPAATGAYRFTSWTGDLAGGDTPGLLVVDEQKLITGGFGVPGSPAAVVNAASFLNTSSVSPGQIVTVFGLDLGPSEIVMGEFVNRRLQTLVADTRVLFDGIAAPIVYVAPNQISAIVPYGVANRLTTSMRVEYRGQLGPSGLLNVVPAAPGLFTSDSSGRGPGALLNQNGSRNSASTPAPKGSVVVLYGTGEGVTNPGSTDGAIATALIGPRLPVKVKIAGRNAQALYAGAAPGLVAGLVQINVRIPDDCPSGDVPVVVWFGDYSSPGNVTVAVQ